MYLDKVDACRCRRLPLGESERPSQLVMVGVTDRRFERFHEAEGEATYEPASSRSCATATAMPVAASVRMLACTVTSGVDLGVVSESLAPVSYGFRRLPAPMRNRLGPCS